MKTFMRSFILVSVALLAMLILFVKLTSNWSDQPPVAEKPTIILPEYWVVEEDVGKPNPIKYAVSSRIVVGDENITKDQLKALIRKIYRDNKKLPGNDYFDQPNQYFIWVYSTIEKSKGAEWLAMGYKDTGKNMDISFSDHEIEIHNSIN